MVRFLASGVAFGDAPATISDASGVEADDLTEDVTLTFKGSDRMSFDCLTTVAGVSAATIHGNLTRGR